MEQIKVIDEDVAYVAENKAAIVERYTELFTNIAE
jgi:iron(III) transport system substrate-binding protein